RCPAPGRRKPHVRATRDGYGVPHVKGNNLYDAGYGIGMAQAEDRLFQMEFVRKSAAGYLAEIGGTSFLSDDQDARRQFYTTEEQEYLFSTLSCPLQTLVHGYVDGVNAWLTQIYADQTLAKVPHEFFFLPKVVRALGNGTIP